METGLSSPIPVTYQDRARVLSDRCHYSHSSTCDLCGHDTSEILRKHPWFNSVTFLLQSQSLMFCAVPKVATKTIVTAIIYIHLRKIHDQLSNNRSNINVDRVRVEQLINIPTLVKELRRVRRLNINIILKSFFESFILEWDDNLKHKRTDFSCLIGGHVSSCLPIRYHQ
jgi:hypothetical protein